MGASTIEHVILTRFNLATPGREEEIRNRPGWLSRRFELFERFCLPSIAAQTCQDFTWIIYFDKDTPQEFKDRIAELQTQFPFVPYFTGLFPADGWRNSVREILGQRGKAPDWLISTRLDNDDALASRYVARIQDAAQAESGPGATAFNITHGCVMTPDRIYDLPHRSNPFFSLLEPYGAEIKTAFAIQHMTLAEHAQVVQIDGPPGWLQIIHGDNVSNKIRGTLIRPEDARAEFFEGAIDGIPAPHPLTLWTENGLKAPLRRLRDRLAAARRQPTYN